MGELVRQPGVGARPGCCSPPTAPCWPTPPSEQQVVARVERARRQRARHDQRRACTGGTGVSWSPADGRRRGARRADVRPDARQLVAARVVHRADRRISTRPTSPASRRTPGSPTRSFRPPRQSEASGGSAAESALRSVQLPLAAMPGGARVGSLVHAVLEHVDFAAPDLADTIATGLAERLAWSRVDIGPVDAVVDGLVAAIETPLGPLVGDARLRDIGRADRLDELGFELPARRRRHAGGRPHAGGARRRARRPRRRRRSARRLRGEAARPAAAPAAARLPHRQPRPRPPPRRRRRHGRASPSSTTRRTGSASTARS